MKLLTRKEAAARLGMSVATLRRREGVLITPVMSPLGEHLFDPAAVRELAAKGAPLVRGSGKLNMAQRLAVYRATKSGSADRDWLAAKYSTTASTVARYSYKKPRLSPEDHAEIRMQRANGVSAGDLAEQYGVAASTVRKLGKTREK